MSLQERSDPSALLVDMLGARPVGETLGARQQIG
jgi:hypothetical protein